MSMLGKYSCSPAVVCYLVVAIYSTPAVADFMLFRGVDTTFGRSIRWSDDGTDRGSYGPQNNWLSDFGEESGMTHVLSPDKKIDYIFTNSLGFAEVVPFDVATRAPLVTFFPGSRTISGVTGDAVDFEAAHCCGNSASAILRASSPIYQHNSATGRDELFVVSNGGFAGFPPGSQIKRFNGQTGEFTQSIDAPSSGLEIQDIALDSHGVLYAATQMGVYTYRSVLGSYGSIDIPPRPNPPLLRIPDVTGDMALGPDGSLFVSETGSGNINRYNPATGLFLGTFLTPGSLGADELGLIEFAPDGTLYVLSGRNEPGQGQAGYISRVNGLTGAVLSSAVYQSATPFNVYGGPLLVLPVPEPTASSISMIAAMRLVFRGRRTCLARPSSKV